MEKEPLKNENVKAKEVCKSMYTPKSGDYMIWVSPEILEK